ncbi:MAG: hypothetical protein WCY01_00660 [Alkalispirochaeta sp.]|jgi:type II secretory pathway pseudopilin PulG
MSLFQGKRGRAERIEGWILAEVVVVMTILAIATAATGDLLTAYIRNCRTVSEELSLQRKRTSAVLYACRLGNETVPFPAIAEELKHRFPELDISLIENGVVIDGEELFPGACR